jgi:hypothetical protein
VKALSGITKQQAKTIVSLQTGVSVSNRSTPKSWSLYSSSHRSIKRKKIATNLEAALSVCASHFVPISVEVENVESGERETIDVKRYCSKEEKFTIEGRYHPLCKRSLFPF